MDDEKLASVTQAKVVSDMAGVRNALASRYAGYDHKEVMGVEHSEIQRPNFIDKAKKMVVVEVKVGRQNRRTSALSPVKPTEEASSPFATSSEKRPNIYSRLDDLKLMKNDLLAKRGLAVKALDIQKLDHRRKSTSPSARRNSIQRSTPLSSRRRSSVGNGGSPTASAVPILKPLTTNTSRGTSPEDVRMADGKKRSAKDHLLLAQLRAGKIPEPFFKNSSNSRFVTIDLSNYGIGDTHGLCLSER
jgi:hypothetical protein